MTTTYERRRRILVNALEETLPLGFRVGPAQTGLHLTVNGPADFDDVRAANSMSEGQRVLPVSALCIDRTDARGLTMGFSAGSDEAIASAARALGTMLHDYAPV